MFDNKRIETYANENYDKDIISRKYVEIYKNICRKRKWKVYRHEYRKAESIFDNEGI